MLKVLKKIWTSLTDPTNALERKYDKLLREARDLQRKGDIPAFAKKTREAEDLMKKIQELKK